MSGLQAVAGGVPRPRCRRPGMGASVALQTAENQIRLRIWPISLRVHVPNNQVLGFWVIVIIVQVLGKYIIIGYLDP